MSQFDLKANWENWVRDEGLRMKRCESPSSISVGDQKGTVRKEKVRGMVMAISVEESFSSKE